MCLARFRVSSWRNSGHSLLPLVGVLIIYLVPITSWLFVYSVLFVSAHSVCHRGFFNCTYFPCPAVCTIYSDRHYHTFDGLEYDYVSDCQVYLVKVLLKVFV